MTFDQRDLLVRMEGNQISTQDSSTEATNGISGGMNLDLCVMKLKTVYPQCKVISKQTTSNGCTILCVQPCEDLDMMLHFSMPAAYPRVASSVSITSRSLSKKDMQPLQRSLELHTSSVFSDDVLEEVLDMVYDFIKLENLCSVTKKPSSGKKKKKKNRASKNEAAREDHVEPEGNEMCGIKLKTRKGKRNLRRLNQNEDSDDSSQELSALSTECAFPFQENAVSVDCAIPDLKARPTHFIAVRVTCKNITDKLVSAQRELVSREPLLEKGVFAPEIFHLTLFTLGLDSDEDIEHCVHVLTKMKPQLEECCPLHPIVVNGMSQFYNRAVFAKVVLEQDFTDFQKSIRIGLESGGVEIRDQYKNFSPHVTIIKVKRPERKMFGSRNIQPAIYAHLKDALFGEQTIDGIYLCPMGGQRREDGFYRTLFEMNLNK